MHHIFDSKVLVKAEGDHSGHSEDEILLSFPSQVDRDY